MSDSPLPKKLLIVDDDPSFIQGLEQGLSKHNVPVVRGVQLQTAQYHFNQQRFEVVLVELEYAELPGLALVQKWRKHENPDRRSVGFIAVSAQKRSAGEEALIRELGDIELIVKPISAIQLLSHLLRATQNMQATQKYQELQSTVLDFYTKQGDFAKAAAILKEKLPALGHLGMETLYDLYEKPGKFDEALTVVEDLLKKNPNDLSLLNTKGKLLMKLKRYDQAKECLEKADQQAPMNIERIQTMAEMYLELNDEKRAVEKFHQLTSLCPENPDLKFEAYNKMYDKGMQETARQFVRKTATPMDIVRFFNNKGVLSAKAGKPEEALQDYQRAIEFFPNFRENYRIHYNIGLSLAAKKTPEDNIKAEEHLKKALELSPEFDKAKTALESLQKRLVKST